MKHKWKNGKETMQERCSEYLISHGLISSCSASKKILEKLDSIFKLKSDFNKVLLRDKFHQIKIENNETVIQYIAQIENLAHQIKDSVKVLVMQLSLQKLQTSLVIC